MSAEPAAGPSDIELLARAALNNGQAALLAQDNDEALRWLDRAQRLVPQDPNVTLALASAWLARDAERAGLLFERVAKVHDVAQAWLGLAACHLRHGERERALVPLSYVLANHALVAESLDLIDRIGIETGWCGLFSDGRMKICPPAGRVGKPRVSLDGKAVTGTRLGPYWPLASRVDVLVDGRHLPGSPIRIDSIRHLVGCVETMAGGIVGWAWHPNDPATDPELRLRCLASNQERRIIARERGRHFPNVGPLAQPRGFAIPTTELPTGGGMIEVLSPDGRPLLGSPLDPRAEEDAQAAGALAIGKAYVAAAQSSSKKTRPPRSDHHSPAAAISRWVAALSLLADAPLPPVPVGADGRTRTQVVIIPVHNGGTVVQACLDSVLVSVQDAQVVVVDDGSTDPATIAHLDLLSKSRRIRLIRRPEAEGFPSAANAGMRAARGQDVVLLNSDTLLPPNWLPRLKAAAYSDRNIGTVTPLSNDASILSYPMEAGRNPVPAQGDVNRIDRLAQRANKDVTVDIPVGVGFCLYIRRDCLDAVGVFRADVFAQGYGEENDFCLRARHLGWRSVALPGLFVGHLGGASFGGAAAHLRGRNARIVERLHPGHDAMIESWLARDALAEPRRRIDMLRWSNSRRGEAVLLVTHDDGGGVEVRVAASADAHRKAGLRPIILRPARTPTGQPAIAVHDGIGDDFANLVFAMPSEADLLLRLLRANRPRLVEVHHLADFSAAVYDLLARLALPCDVFVHDYAWFCARISLVSRDSYCGEPGAAGCSICVADHGRFLSEAIAPIELLQRSAAFLSRARLVVVPSTDAGTRMRRHFPGLETVTRPHENDGDLPPMQRPRVGQGRVRVCVVGGIGLHKGYHVILACARDADARNLDLDYVVVGNTIDDARLMATGRVFVTGRYQSNEVGELIGRQNADIGFVPSVWPETWCLALSEIWRAGLPACAFDFGAPAERIQQTGRGFVLPVGLPPAGINNALMRAVRNARENSVVVPVSPPAMRLVASGNVHDFAMHTQK